MENGKNYSNKFQVDRELSIISILINCYKKESRQYIKTELYYLLKRMEKRFSENAYPLDVLDLLKNNTEKKEKRVITGKDFLIRSNLWKCINPKHTLEDIIAEVDIVLSDGTFMKENIPAAYCSSCNLYYILDADYRKLKQKGTILCRIAKREYFIKKENRGNNIYDGMNEESVLYSLGYNVNAQEALTVHQRHAILVTAVTQNILSKAEICNHLDWLINRSKRNITMQNAVRKWTADREYITQYKKKELNTEKVKVISMEINEYKRK